ncbi:MULTISPECIES: DeoR/GlpR family DNA-binding transcription regulator [Agrobacterium]|uniref:DeoR/GlpR family transcriptional regulator of sugar metabolism n=1 Tax=Agrobacterium larrymoorei TaxID=160699 RepID=A0AAJ2B9T0_9HYPH|nr:DeoR/GlpR family DNA-binding transcription regulator [Agrobacterium larrymoorei]MDQ1198450.1 DeoR/GlpR family transcriptional regulator of sugar metabolism [Rhizobium sp. SORGH_AS_0787]MDR6102226.1 DeoR/GlpR family transcriptional regulator of sugar metabolism [Agrobacterium larrymoorei]
MNTPSNRKAHILEKISSGQPVSVTEIASDLKVSEMTIRRDLAELEKEGLLKRVHGGAVSTFGRGYEPPFILRNAQAVAAKNAIGELAASLVSEGDSIALDVGSTAAEVARHLAGRRGLTIVTPSLRVVEHFVSNKDVRLIVAGGILRCGEGSLVGELACQTFRDLFVDKLFLGVGGISCEAGLTDYNWDDALVKKAMIKSAKEIIVTADASKFDRTAFAKIAEIDGFNTLITDRAPPKDIAEIFARKGIAVHIANARAKPEEPDRDAQTA